MQRMPRLSLLPHKHQNHKSIMRSLQSTTGKHLQSNTNHRNSNTPITHLNITKKMDFIQLISQYRPVTHNILEHLSTEDRRILFFSSTHIQKILTPYPQMKTLADTTNQAHMTYYFPKLTHGKHESRYALRRNIRSYQTNALATKIPCQTCGTLYYNVEYETEFKLCKDHKQYSYAKGEMKVKRRGQDLFGKYWVSRETYKPTGPARALCYCKTCKKFLYYTPIATGFKFRTCMDCLYAEHDQDRLLHQKTVINIRIDNSQAFYVQPYIFQATPLQPIRNTQLV